MDEIEVTVENNKLVIKLPIQQPTLSKTGRSFIVASTGGFLKTTASVASKQVSISVNACIPKN